MRIGRLLKGAGLYLFLFAAACMLWACAQEEPTVVAENEDRTIKIVVDAGHGDTDPGAIGASGTTREKDVNLQIALKLEAELAERGYAVEMIRRSDDPIAAESEGDIALRKEADMTEREKRIAESNADMYIGIHQNYYEDAEVSGPQVFYYTDSVQGEILAKILQEALNSGLNPAVPRTAVAGRYRLLKSGAQPSVTVECGFVSNPAEEAVLLDEDYQDRIAECIVEGIDRYVREEIKG